MFVRIYASGVRQFYVEYTRNRQRRKYLIGRADALTVGQARDRAREPLAQVALHGSFPDKESTKEATMLSKFLGDLF